MSDDQQQPPDNEPERPEDMLAAFLGGAMPNPDQLAEAMASMGMPPMDPALLGQVAAQMRTLFSGPASEPLDAELARDMARRVVSAEGDPSVAQSTKNDVEQVALVANLWLDEVTELPRTTGPVHAWSRSEWVEATMPVWADLTRPVASGIAAAMAGTMTAQMGEIGELGGLGGLVPGMAPADALAPMVNRMAGAMLGLKLGQAVGAMAGETVTGSEVGIPLLPAGTLAVLPRNVAAFAEGLELDPGEMHLYLVVREAARARLFAAHPWIGSLLLAAVQDYARDIRIDADAIAEALREVDLQDPAAVQERLSGSLFHPEPSPGQLAALRRLETSLALVEGWVDVVTQQATARLPHGPALAEAVRRRRAGGGPAEDLLRELVGLTLRPRRMREAATLFAAVEARHGAEARDDAWAHPDVAPTGDDLDDPLGYAARLGGVSSLDDELAALLGEDGEAPTEPR